MALSLRAIILSDCRERRSLVSRRETRLLCRASLSSGSIPNFQVARALATVQPRPRHDHTLAHAPTSATGTAAGGVGGGQMGSISSARLRAITSRVRPRMSSLLARVWQTRSIKSEINSRLIFTARLGARTASLAFVRRLLSAISCPLRAIRTLLRSIDPARRRHIVLIFNRRAAPSAATWLLK